ncbi:MAG: translation elongation factor Ts [Flavobacteriales bacterium]
MSVTAADVKKLRETTGAGMMDCKKALSESDNDFDKAIEILRKKGQKVAAKRQDREASEGFAVARSSSDNKLGVLVAVNCETDFVAKNDEFKGFAKNIAEVAVENNISSVEELQSCSYPDENIEIKEKLADLVGKIGEKIVIGEVNKIEAETVVPYEHPGNRLAALVGLNKSGDEVYEVGKDIAMQIAAMNPVSLDENDVPQDIIDRELEVGKDQARQEGKPEDIVDKIAQGKLKKFYKENTLLNQAFIKDNKQAVRDYLQSHDKELTVTEFKRYSLDQ